MQKSSVANNPKGKVFFRVGGNSIETQSSFGLRKRFESTEAGNSPHAVTANTSAQTFVFNKFHQIRIIFNVLCRISNFLCRKSFSAFSFLPITNLLPSRPHFRLFFYFHTSNIFFFPLWNHKWIQIRCYLLNIASIFLHSETFLKTFFEAGKNRKISLSNSIATFCLRRNNWERKRSNLMSERIQFKAIKGEITNLAQMSCNWIFQTFAASVATLSCSVEAVDFLEWRKKQKLSSLNRQNIHR